MASTGNGKITLYYHPFSYFSQRAALTLEEKGLDYDVKLIDHHSDDNKNPTFLKMNPEGEVPVITYNGHNVPDSNKILDFLDEQFIDSPKLQPDEGSSEGQKVRQWRNKIDSIVIETVTFGAVIQRKHITKNSQFPAASTRMVGEKLKTTEEMCKKYSAKYPEYKELFEKKVIKFKELHQSASDLNVVKKEIENMDTVLDEIEQQLQETSQDVAEGEDYWLLGKTFTAADVFVAVLLSRLRLVGLIHHVQDRQPLLTAYYNRLQERPSFKKVCMLSLSPIIWMMAVQKMKKAVPVLLGIGLVGVAVAFGYKYIKEKDWSPFTK